MDRKEDLIKQIERAEQDLALEAPKNIGKNLSRCIELKRMYSEYVRTNNISDT